MNDDLNPTQLMVLQAIERAAEAGHQCPSNAQIFDLVGCGINQGSQIIAALERKGVITVERRQNRRVVTIVSTGKRTAGDISAAHWRYAGHAKKIKGGREMHSPVRRTDSQIDALPRVDRDPCFFCGARKDACRCGHGTHL